MLAGFPDFKSSLKHEYVGVIRDFRDRVRGRVGACTRGLEVARLVDAVYAMDGARRGAAA